jgi:hypothetical protein
MPGADTSARTNNITLRRTMAAGSIAEAAVRANTEGSAATFLRNRHAFIDSAAQYASA